MFNYIKYLCHTVSVIFFVVANTPNNCHSIILPGCITDLKVRSAAVFAGHAVSDHADLITC